MCVTTNAMTRRGWYPDPAGSGRMRYFNGTAWTDLYRPKRVAASAPSRTDQQDSLEESNARLAALPRRQLLLLNVFVVVVVLTHLMLFGWVTVGWGDKSSPWHSHQFSWKLAPAYIKWMPIYTFAGYWALLAAAVRFLRQGWAAQRRGDSARAAALEGVAVIVAVLGLVVSIAAVVVSITYLSHLPRGHPFVPHSVAESTSSLAPAGESR